MNQLVRTPEVESLTLSPLTQTIGAEDWKVLFFRDQTSPPSSTWISPATSAPLKFIPATIIGKRPV